MNLPKELPKLQMNDESLKTISTAAYTPNNYWRIFYNQAIPVLAHFANTSTLIFLYLLYNADSNNKVFGSYTDILVGCGISSRSQVSKVLKELEEAEVIVRLGTSYYMINPAIVVKGDNQKFGLLASQFNDFLMESKARKRGN